MVEAQVLLWKRIRTMNSIKSSGRDENANTDVPDANGPNELSNYAQDALKEVLGWYGLQEPGSDPSAASRGGVAPAGTASKIRAAPPLEPVLVLPNGHSDDSETPLDLTNGHASEMANADPSPSPSAPLSAHGSWSGHRKLIGMRFLFPPLSDDMTLLDKAKIWVARHDHKYFVGWSREQLDNADTMLRPIAPISPEMYKLHMNRSEYCRNVKLKYCLESDADWAQEFRVKLTRPSSEGGFTGLCQAKIAAAELWRTYSENYRSHQARYPNPKSKYRSRSLQEGEQDLSGCGQAPGSSDKRKAASLAEDGLMQGECGEEYVDSADGIKRFRYFDEMDMMYDDEYGDKSGDEMLSDSDDSAKEVHAPRDPSTEATAREPAAVERPPSRELEASEQQKNEGDLRPGSDHPHGAPSVEPSPEPASSTSTPSLMERALASQQAYFPGGMSAAAAAAAYYGLPVTMYTNPTSHFQHAAAAAAAAAAGDASALASPFLSPYAIASHAVSADTFNFSSGGKQGKHTDKQHEYKRSERGLSFLFPSLSDHNLSLLDKVKITVIRHKNNYFLGWSDEDLNKVHPLIRPKMTVTQEIYKEYCHRNAMKYDSNLQFAMESAEDWAQEFKAKLTRPPSEGGFSSLCEVKLEAGRLWREYSGKYRMHNIVKWQMDLNSASKATKQEVLECQLAEKQAGEPGSPEVEGARPSRRDLRSTNSTPVDSMSDLPLSRRRSSDTKYALCGAIKTEDAYLALSAVSPILCNTSESLQGFRSPVCGATVADAALVNSRSLAEPLSEGSSRSSSLSSPPERALNVQSDGAKGRYACSSSRGFLSAQEMLPGALSVPNLPMMSLPSLMWQPNVDLTSSAFRGQFVADEPCSNATHIDSLFRPLPKNFSVAEQIYIWLERHRHNYFLGYGKEELMYLNEYLRPQVLVTDEVIKKYLPESMVDVLAKIEYMMVCGESWAMDFRDKVHHSYLEGGFSAFEDAITEAVIVWNKAKARGETKPQTDDRVPAPETVSSLNLSTIKDLTATGHQSRDEEPSASSSSSGVGGYREAGGIVAVTRDGASGSSPSDMAPVPSAPTEFKNQGIVELKTVPGVAGETVSGVAVAGENHYLKMEEEAEEEEEEEEEKLVIHDLSVEAAAEAGQQPAVVEDIDLCQSSNLSKSVKDLSMDSSAAAEAAESRWKQGKQQDSQPEQPRLDAQDLSKDTPQLAVQSRARPGWRCSSEEQEEQDQVEEEQEASAGRAVSPSQGVQCGAQLPGSARDRPRAPQCCAQLPGSPRGRPRAQPAGIRDCIWQMREDLQMLCADDPRQSWAERLQSFLPTLQQQLGANYTLPAAISSCAVDLILAVLHKHIAGYEETPVHTT